MLRAEAYAAARGIRARARVAEEFGARHAEFGDARRLERARAQRLLRQRAQRIGGRPRVFALPFEPAALEGREHDVCRARSLPHLVRREVGQIVQGDDAHAARLQARGDALVARERGRVDVAVVVQRVGLHPPRQLAQFAGEIALQQDQLAAARAQVATQLRERIEEERDDRRTDSVGAQQRRIEHERADHFAALPRGEVERDVIVESQIPAKPDDRASKPDSHVSLVPQAAPAAPLTP